MTDPQRSSRTARNEKRSPATEASFPETLVYLVGAITAVGAVVVVPDATSSSVRGFANLFVLSVPVWTFGFAALATDAELRPPSASNGHPGPLESLGLLAVAVGSAVIIYGSIAGIAGQYVVWAHVALGIVVYFVAPFWLARRFLAGNTRFNAGVLTVMLSFLVLVMGMILRGALGSVPEFAAIGIALCAFATYDASREPGILGRLWD